MPPPRGIRNRCFAEEEQMKIGRMEDVLLHFFDSCTLLNKLNDISSPLISKLVCSSSSYCVDRLSQW